MDIFERAFQLVVDCEGKFNDDVRDPGNWTGGAVGRGVCRGTKFGISAAAYPTLDIAALTLTDAASIYRRDYWDRIGCDGLAPVLAVTVFDAAINNGVSRARSWLGVANYKTAAPTEACAEFMAQRLNYMANLPMWKTFGLGWARRLCRLPFEAVRISTTQ